MINTKVPSAARRISPSGAQFTIFYTTSPAASRFPGLIWDWVQQPLVGAHLLNSMPKHVLLIAMCAALVSAQDKAIDVQRSTITVHVGTAGVFSVAGHEHWVNAPISAGVLNDSDRRHVEFKVDASRMAVKADMKVDAKTQAEIQRDMQEKTLESARYPEISFRSSRVEKQTDGQWKVDGTLTQTA